ncbi:MAG: ribosome biogenesis GTPase YlqF [Ruminococcaceae bacterium]|nr:ribosome biogenesis GTPase YlqF [Oscillospiraceae bacterium]
MAVIQWFPGHMAKARRILSENLSEVDVVVELCDARIPFSSRNPEIVKVIGNKPSVLVFNKADLADPKMCDFWKNYYNDKGIQIVFTDSKKGDGIKKVTEAIKKTMAEKIKNQEEKGRLNPHIRAMIVGVPNVGKSSFINRVAGKAVAVTGDKPGVTRSKQWLKMGSNIYLLDTPGLLWPKIEDQRCGYRLACTGAIKDDILDNTDIAGFLLEFMRESYVDALCTRFKLNPDDLEDLDRLQLVTMCGKKRGCIVKGGEVDLVRAATIVLDEFRGGKMGRISLDTPEALEPDPNTIVEDENND